MLFFKFTKCEFWLEPVSFLRHVVSKMSITIEPTKIFAIHDWARPTAQTKLLKFIGLDGFKGTLLRALLPYQPL